MSQYLPKIKGVICVSTKNMFESIDLNLANQSKIAVIPNAIDGNRFYFENKLDVRKNLVLMKKILLLHLRVRLITEKVH